MADTRASSATDSAATLREMMQSASTLMLARWILKNLDWSGGNSDENGEFLASILEEHARQVRSVVVSETGRSEIIEEVAKAIESAPLTYAGPDPHVVSDLRYLIVCSIRDLKRPSGNKESNHG